MERMYLEGGVECFTDRLVRTVNDLDLVRLVKAHCEMVASLTECARCFAQDKRVFIVSRAGEECSVERVSELGRAVEQGEQEFSCWCSQITVGPCGYHSTRLLPLSNQGK